MNKQTKQAMAVAAGVLALVGLQSITVPVPSLPTLPQMSNEAIGDGVMRSRKRPRHYMERNVDHPLRARATRQTVLAE